MKKKRFSYSTGKQLLDNIPEVAIYNLENKEVETSSAMMMGKYIEHAVDFGTDCFSVWTETKTKGVKYDKFVSENPELKVVMQEEYERIVQSSSNIITRFPYLKSCDRQQEVSFEEDGVPVYGFTDWENETDIYDLKVSNIGRFNKQVFAMYWCLQAYIYHKARRNKDFSWIVVDDCAPYAVRKYKASDHMLKIGEGMYRRATNLYIKYQNDSLTEEINEELTVPNWADQVWLF